MIDSFPIQTADGDLAWTGRLLWGAESLASTHDAMERASESSDQKSVYTRLARGLLDPEWWQGGIRKDQKGGVWSRSFRERAALRSASAED